MSESQFANGKPAQNGVVPKNNAGIDLTPATMNALGVKGKENNRQAPVDIKVIPPPDKATPPPPPPPPQT